MCAPQHIPEAIGYARAVHGAAIALSPLLAEKSRTPFYIAGGLLAVWAVTVSVGLGLRKPRFPGGLGGERAVIAITAVLVLAAVSAAVATSSPPAKSAVAATTKPASAAAPPPPEAPPPATTGAPKATTGTPAPPSSPARKGGASAVALTANPAGLLSYNTKQVSAKAGSVTITLTNAAPLEHNVTIAEGSRVIGATPTFTGGSRTVTLTLNPGTYTFYCSVPGHRQGGMEGTLSVT
jgi:plastocyanin